MSGGYGAELVWCCRSAIGRVVVLSAAAVLGLVAAYQAVILSFVRYDDNSYPYVYAHTSRDVLALVAKVQRLEEHNPDMTIAITSESHFPLSWYLRSYSAGYYGQPLVTNDSLVIGSDAQREALDRLLGDRYSNMRPYRLRPGVGLVLYTRRDVAGLGSTDSSQTATDK